MADDVKVTNFPEPTTKERVAYDLYRDVMSAEGKFLRSENPANRADRKYILDLYAECLTATKDRR